MSAILALYTLMGQTIVRQDAIISALKTKGILSGDDIKAALPSDEQIAKVMQNLQNEFISIIKDLEARGV